MVHLVEKTLVRVLCLGIACIHPYLVSTVLPTQEQWKVKFSIDPFCKTELKWFFAHTKHSAAVLVGWNLNLKWLSSNPIFLSMNYMNQSAMGGVESQHRKILRDPAIFRERDIGGRFP